MKCTSSYEIRDGATGAYASGNGIEEVAVLEAASSPQILVLRRRNRVRLRTHKGSVLYALGSGFLIETAHFKVPVPRGYACVNEASHDVDIVLPERPAACVLGIIPDDNRLEQASMLARGERLPRPVLFPQLSWQPSPDLTPPLDAMDRWRLDSRAAQELRIWADRMLVACLDQQSGYHEMAARCSGRNWVQKEAMLCRLLRARIAMQQSDSVRVAEGAKVALLSTSGFIAQYREVFGETPVRNAYGSRLEEALVQLADGTHAVRDVAEYVGYGNRCSFSRAFKSRFGFSPKEAVGRVKHP